MTVEQYKRVDWKRVEKIIKEDCEIENHMFANGQTCALGGLAVAVGYKKGQSLNHLTWRSMARRIEAQLGLPHAVVPGIPTVNDGSFATKRERQQAVIKYLKAATKGYTDDGLFDYADYIDS